MTRVREKLKARTAWRRTAMVGCSLVLWSLSLSPLGAITVSTEQPEIGLMPALQIEDGQVHLTLEEAVELALSRNLGLVVQRYDRAQFELGIQQNRGIYDLTSTATLSTFNETSPAASNLDGAPIGETSGDSFDFELSQVVPVGGRVLLNWNNSKFDTNSIFASVNPSFTIDLDLTYQQPLMRDLGRLATERNLKVARNNSDISFEEFERQVILSLQQVVNAYWDVVEAREQLNVAKESLALAEELHDMNKIQVEVGTMAPLELVQSEVGVATREEGIIRAQGAVGDAEDRLRQLLNLEAGELWNLEIVPVTDPETTHQVIDLEGSIATALNERQEIRQQMLQLKSLEIDAAYFRNQKRPRLDMQLRYGYNGLGGDAFIPNQGAPEEIIPGGYSDAWDQVKNGDFDGWSVGVQLLYPIQNRAGKAQSAIANVALEQGETVLEDLKLAVLTEVRTAARGVDTAAKQIESARVSSRLAQRNLEAERKRYENGLSTSFQVLEIQEDLSQARSREVSAVISYRRALAEFYRSIGTMLEEKGIELVDSVGG